MQRFTLAMLFAFGSSAALAQTPAPQPDSTLDAYASAARRVDIGAGRSLNLRCSGEAGPSVLLEAGFGADSLAWSKLQPMLAKRMRVCSYDRAGYGFSDAGPLPRNLEAEVADLHALVEAADLPMPAIFVGHSLGSNIVRRYDELHSGDVSALVLVDPPPQDVGAFSATYAKVEREMAPAMLAAYRRCEQGAKDAKLAAPPPELQSCLRGPNPAYSDKLNAAIRQYRSAPPFWSTILSGSEAKLELFDAPVPATERHGDKPVIVLTAVDAYAGAEPADRKALEAARNQTHAALVATSSRGKRIEVGKTSHDLQLDDPQAVFDAIVRASEAP